MDVNKVYYKLFDEIDKGRNDTYNSREKVLKKIVDKAKLEGKLEAYRELNVDKEIKQKR